MHVCIYYTIGQGSIHMLTPVEVFCKAWPGDMHCVQKDMVPKCVLEMDPLPGFIGCILLVDNAETLVWIVVCDDGSVPPLTL